jgi:hypothetical protein
LGDFPGGRWNVFGLLTGDYLRLWSFVGRCRHSRSQCSADASAAAEETKGRGFSRPQAGIAGSLLQAVLEVNPGAIVQVDPKIVSIACAEWQYAGLAGAYRQRTSWLLSRGGESPILKGDCSALTGMRGHEQEPSADCKRCERNTNILTSAMAPNYPTASNRSVRHR